MDDYNISAIYEAKNEYSARLIDIITPLVIEGIKSIFKEALELCIVNDEKEKYLMTFQNFLTRVPKWNQSIINVESERIVKKSGCLYLDDLPENYIQTFTCLKLLFHLYKFKKITENVN